VDAQTSVALEASYFRFQRSSPFLIEMRLEQGSGPYVTGTQQIAKSCELQYLKKDRK
jgi:hypothetical protein